MRYAGTFLSCLCGLINAAVKVNRITVDKWSLPTGQAGVATAVAPCGAVGFQVKLTDHIQVAAHPVRK